MHIHFQLQYLSVTLLSCEGFPYAVVIGGVISNDDVSMTFRHSVNISKIRIKRFRASFATNLSEPVNRNIYVQQNINL